MAELAIVFVFTLKMKNSLFIFLIYSTNAPFFRVKIVFCLFTFFGFKALCRFCFVRRPNSGFVTAIFNFYAICESTIKN